MSIMSEAATQELWPGRNLDSRDRLLSHSKEQLWDVAMSTYSIRASL